MKIDSKQTPGGTAVASSNTFIERGEFWMIRYAGKEVAIKNRKGMRLLALMLQSPGESFTLQELTEVNGDIYIGKSATIDDTLDTQAQDEATKKLEDLNREIAEAEARNNLVMVDLLTADRDSIIEQLGVDLDSRGRARKYDPQAERIRKRLYKNIHEAIQAISKHHPELGRHLRRSIETGYQSRYSPEKSTDWKVSFICYSPGSVAPQFVADVHVEGDEASFA